MVLRKILFVPAVILFSAACVSTGGISHQVVIEQDSRVFIGSLKSDYERGNMNEFFKKFNKSEFPNYDAYSENVRDFVIKNRAITLDFIYDSVTEDDEEFSVRFHWNKSYISGTGENVLNQGACEFLLQARPAGGFALVAINGDSPF